MSSLEPPRTPNIPPEVLPLRARQFRMPKSLAAMRHRNYRLFLIGQLVSLAGTWMQIIGQGWLVYELSRSELALGLVGFAAAIPVLTLTPWAGVVVDRVSRRELLLITQVAGKLLALILAVLVFTNTVEVWHVIVLAVLLGVVNAFDGPARQAFVVEMVGREDLPNAIALNSMTFNVGRILGPAIGGLLLVAVGAAWCFLLNALSGIVLAAGLLAMDVPKRVVKPETTSPWSQLRGGVAYAAMNPNLRALLLIALVVSLFGISYSTVLPAFVDQVLGQGPGAFGAINMASGMGAVSGAFMIAQFGDRGQRGLWLCMALMAAPVLLILFALNQWYWVALVLALIMGMGFMVVFTLVNTLLQTSIVDEMRGRVASLYTLTFFGFTPFGNLVVGSMSEMMGMSLALTVNAVIALLLSLAIVLWTPSLWQMR